MHRAAATFTEDDKQSAYHHHHHQAAASRGAYDSSSSGRTSFDDFEYDAEQRPSLSDIEDKAGSTMRGPKQRAGVDQADCSSDSSLSASSAGAYAARYPRITMSPPARLKQQRSSSWLGSLVPPFLSTSRGAHAAGLPSYSLGPPPTTTINEANSPASIYSGTFAASHPSAPLLGGATTATSTGSTINSRDGAKAARPSNSRKAWLHGAQRRLVASRRLVLLLIMALCSLVMLYHRLTTTTTTEEEVALANARARMEIAARIRIEQENEKVRGSVDESYLGRAKAAFRGVLYRGDERAAPDLDDEEPLEDWFALKAVLNFPEGPHESFTAQLKDGVRYVTGMAYGGHSNQFISVMRVLYLAKTLNRVAIVPTFIPSHFLGPYVDFDLFYDLDGFMRRSHIPAVPMSRLKRAARLGEARPPHNDEVSCWSVSEQTTGMANLGAESMDAHGVWVHHWALPPMHRSLGGFDLAYDSLRLFDFDGQMRADWVAKVRREWLPQVARPAKDDQGRPTKPLRGDGALAANLKPGFEPDKSAPPTDQLFCVDNTMFVGPVMFPQPYQTPVETEPSIAGEGLSWLDAGVHVRFAPRVEATLDALLARLFRDHATVPPFISVHLRRGDFQDFGGFTDLDKYVRAVGRVQARVARRVAEPHSWRGPGKRSWDTQHAPRVRDALAAASSGESKLEVVFTTDETDAAFLRTVAREHGWRLFDHASMGTLELLQARGLTGYTHEQVVDARARARTQARAEQDVTRLTYQAQDDLAGWWLPVLDAALLARGAGFVGTDRSTFSHLAGLRVKHWNGAPTDLAS